MFLIKDCNASLDWFAYPNSIDPNYRGQNDESDFEFLVEETQE